MAKSVKLKPGELPKAFAKMPKSRADAKKKDKPYFYSIKGNIVYLHGASIDWKGRAIGKYSPRFPDEPQVTMYDRLVTGVKDDVDVSELRRPKAELVNGAPTLPVVKKEVAPEECPIRRPKPRSIGKLRVVNTPAGMTPKPPKNLKWKSIREWAKERVEFFEQRGDYLTALGLVNLAGSIDMPPERRQKFLSRLRSLYQNEVEAENALLDRLINAPETPPAPKRERAPKDPQDPGRPRDPDKRETTRPERRTREPDPQVPQKQPQKARVNDKMQRVLDAISKGPKTRVEIRKETGLDYVRKPLMALVGQGVVVEKNGKYQLKEKACAERSPSAATKTSKSKSARSQFTPVQTGASGSAGRAPGKSRASSTGGSRSRKPARSEKPRSRRG